MRPTQILSAEHRVIEQVLECLAKIAGDCRSAGKLSTEPARKAVLFLRTFADACHHGKEEAILFPDLEAKGMPRHGGPTGVMLAEHEDGRAAIREIDASIEGAGRGEKAAVASFARGVERYVSLLRQHIHKEDHCLFPMADESLSAQDQSRILAAFDKAESEEMGEGTHEKMLAIADELARECGVRSIASSHAGSGCGCSHQHAR